MCCCAAWCHPPLVCSFGGYKRRCPSSDAIGLIFKSCQTAVKPAFTAYCLAKILRWFILFIRKRVALDFYIKDRVSKDKVMTKLFSKYAVLSKSTGRLQHSCWQWWRNRGSLGGMVTRVWTQVVLCCPTSVLAMDCQYQTPCSNLR